MGQQYREANDTICVGVDLGFGWLPSRSIQQQLNKNQLKALKLRYGSSYYAQLYLIHANSDNPGPGTR